MSFRLVVLFLVFECIALMLMRFAVNYLFSDFTGENSFNHKLQKHTVQRVFNLFSLISAFEWVKCVLCFDRFKNRLCVFYYVFYLLWITRWDGFVFNYFHNQMLLTDAQKNQNIERNWKIYEENIVLFIIAQYSYVKSKNMKKRV